MLKMLLVFFFFSTAFAEIKLSPHEKLPKSEYAVKSLTSMWTRAQFESNFKDFLSNARPSRLVGTEGHDRGKDWLINYIKKADVKNLGKLTVDEFVPDLIRAKNFYELDYQKTYSNPSNRKDANYLKWTNFTNDTIHFLNQLSGVKGTNIIWEKKGYINSDEVLLVFANYDTLVIDSKTYHLNLKSSMPGADSNGSGVMVALSMIELLSSVEIPKTVWIVFTDFDEFAFSGTHAFLQKYNPALKKMKAVFEISLTMLGYDSKSRDKEKKFGNMNLYLRKETEEGHILDKKLATKLLNKSWDETVHFKMVANGFNSSGHSLFWEQGYPAVIFTQNWENDLNPNEHTSEDLFETLNMSTLYASYRFIAGAILGWALDL